MVDPPAGGLLSFMYYVYVLHNKDRDKIYIGQTDDLESRVKRHNGQLPVKKRSFTRLNSGKWRVVYKEEYETRQEAVKREKELKSYRGREFIRMKLMAR